MHRPFDGADIVYLYAAYRRGVQLSGISANLPPAEFKEEVFTRVAFHRNEGGDFITLVCQTPRGMIPVGLIEVNVTMAPDIRPQALPHALWFPEASPRNKLEAVVRFLEQLKNGFTVLLVEQEANWRFFAHVCQYGVLRPVGKLRNYFSDGSDAMFYQGTG